MTKTIQVNGKEIVVVSVPEDACKVDVVAPLGNSMVIYRVGEKDTGVIPIPSANYKILGCCTKDTIDFDCSILVECADKMDSGKCFSWWDYNNIPNQLGSPTDSFRSLLAANGIHFTNPLGDKPKDNGQWMRDYEMENRVAEWREVESKVVKKIIVIQKL